MIIKQVMEKKDRQTYSEKDRQTYLEKDRQTYLEKIAGYYIRRQECSKVRLLLWYINMFETINYTMDDVTKAETINLFYFNYGKFKRKLYSYNEYEIEDSKKDEIIDMIDDAIEENNDSLAYIEYLIEMCNKDFKLPEDIYNNLKNKIPYSKEKGQYEEIWLIMDKLYNESCKYLKNDYFTKLKEYLYSKLEVKD